MELGVKLKVYGTPFFYFMEPDGQAIIRALGYQSAEEFREHLLAAISGSPLTEKISKPVQEMKPVDVDATELITEPESMPSYERPRGAASVTITAPGRKGGSR